MHQTIKVLLVDDESEFTSTLSKRLARQGMDTATASDGGEAYSLLEDARFDVVVLDIAMPGVDGVQVLKAIKQRFHGVEVIMLTGHGTMTHALKALRAGAFDFLHKPVPMEHLKTRITDAALNKAAEPAPRWNQPVAV